MQRWTTARGEGGVIANARSGRGRWWETKRWLSLGKFHVQDLTGVSFSSFSCISQLTDVPTLSGFERTEAIVSR